MTTLDPTAFRESAHGALADAQLKVALARLKTHFVHKRADSIARYGDFEALREAAKRGSFRGLGLTTRVPAPSTGRGDGKPQVRDVQSSVLERGHAPGDGQEAANRQRKGSV